MLLNKFELFKYQWTGRKLNIGFIRFHTTDNYKNDLRELDNKDEPEIYISGLNQKSLEYFIHNYAHKFTVIGITHCSNIQDFSCLSSLSKVTYLIIEWNTKASRLWNMQNNVNLKGLRLDEMKKIVSFDELSSAPYLEELWINEGVNSQLGSNKWLINDLCSISECKLKCLAITISGIKNKDISPLLKMHTIKYLHLQTHLFSFEDYARLNAHLQNTEIYPDKPFYICDNDDYALVVGKRSVKKNSLKLLEYERCWNNILDNVK